MELRHFRYFVALAEQKHFGRAAERLGIAQPGLSQQIKALERRIGVQLVTRDTRSVELTEAGAVFLDHARQTIELADRAMESMRLVRRGKKGLLRVGTGTTGIHCTAGRILHEFRTRLPDVEVEIHPGYVPRNIDALQRRFLDVAFVLAPFESAAPLRYLRLGAIELLVALPEGHRLAALQRIPRVELLKERFLDWPPSINPILVDHLRRSLFGESRHPSSVEISDVDEASRLLLVAQGEGIAVAGSPGLSQLHVAGVAFRPLEDPPLRLEYGIAWLDGHVSPFVPAFVAIGEELCGAISRPANSTSEQAPE